MIAYFCTLEERTRNPECWEHVDVPPEESDLQASPVCPGANYKRVLVCEADSSNSGAQHSNGFDKVFLLE
jgi:hypothetical protein